MSMLDALLARWKAHQASAAGLRELQQCGEATIAEIAADLGLTPNELQAAAAGGSAETLMPRMIAAYGLDRAALESEAPTAMRDVAVICSGCGDKRRCASELDHGTARAHAEAFCPNAPTFEAFLLQPGR